LQKTVKPLEQIGEQTQTHFISGETHVTKTSLGLKRKCSSCAAPFYDLGNNPAACPKCGTMNDINAQPRARRRSKATIEAEAKEKARAAKLKAKKPIKEIEGVDLEEFEEIEAIDAEEEIEEIEEIDDIESIESIEKEPADDEMDDDIALEEKDVGDETLIDTIEDEVEEDEDDDSVNTKKPAAKAKKGKK
jgi:hypothetical protein